MKPKIALCYYPTSVVLVDDDTQLLEALSLALENQFSCMTYADPLRALNHANGLKKPEWNSLLDEEFSNLGDSEQLINRALNFSSKKIVNDQRYKEVSVVVVDYDMPEMNGLEFCRSINSASIKRILLTGRVGAVEAVDAFNQKVIDYYISKYDPDLLQKLVEALKTMQHQYFIDLSTNIKIKAIDNKRSLFRDAALSDYINKILQQHQIEEYYFYSHPSRYELIGVDGCKSILLVYSRSELNEQIQIIKEEAGPEWLINALKTGLYVPFFHSNDGFYDQDNFKADHTLHMAEKIEGNELFYCAHIKPDSESVDSRLLTGSPIFH